MLKQLICVTASLVFSGFGVLGQEAVSGISVPVTVSGDARYTSGDSAEAGKSAATGGFRALVYPTLKLGSHWFFYSAIEAHSSSYFAYEAAPYEERDVDVHVMQAYAGYATSIRRASLLMKAGQMSSAFGLFPLEYDDAKMPLIDPPASYAANLPLRPDQRPCGVADILRQGYGEEIDYRCGGSQIDRYGLVPVTLYGLPAVEADLSVARVDARFQLTNSSPANPQALTSGSQFVQWTAGMGYTLPGGLHLGASGFGGPYLDRALVPYLPRPRSIRSFWASGAGLDAEWARGPWALEGEWQRFRFDVPNFLTSPSEQIVYVQTKRILSPRIFVAMRAAVLQFGSIKDLRGARANQFAGTQEIYEAGGGYRLNRMQLVKFEVNWTHRPAWSDGRWFWPTTDDCRLEAQLVTSLTAVSKAFR